MAGGWARDGAVQEQIDASVEEAVQNARSRLAAGDSLSHCEECDAPIPEARRRAVPGVRLCIDCQAGQEKSPQGRDSINRRASKDSLLR
ncbi:DksA/TraR family C4-type zinc finger protein [Zobellella endophytica]|uniref:DksA/TraR family C4-type zinc finger protein n=1 Tax=Zobellella endophytica TaxID=2116700 RepID=A0A2P7RAX1_9GAMM|nr:DksA/TraR family C4-type zinc finger protein [Zobellella endophytica]PSJ47349.1 DksA/TraR family C4-type zinc finger protein [Zobellella endophytica]